MLDQSTLPASHCSYETLTSSSRTKTASERFGLSGPVYIGLGSSTIDSLCFHGSLSCQGPFPIGASLHVGWRESIVASEGTGEKAGCASLLMNSASGAESLIRRVYSSSASTPARFGEAPVTCRSR